MAKYKKVVSNGQSSEDKALDMMAEYFIKAVETISADWHKPWFTSKGCMAQNLDGRVYNGMNQMFLLLVCEDKGYKTPVFGTFDRLTSKLNFGPDGEILFDEQGEELPMVRINKGERSYPVFIQTTNVINTETKEKISWGKYNDLSEEEQKDYKVYRNTQVHSVFNIDQTNLSETRPELYKQLIDKNNQPNPFEGRKKFHWKKVDDMIATDGWICPIKLEKQDRAAFSPVKNRIILPTFAQFETGEDFYSTCVHEMAHSTGIEAYLNREGITNPNIFGSDAYGKEELIAELTSALVCHANGFNNGIEEQSVAYLQGWLKNIRQDPTFLKSVLVDVKRAYKLITDHIENIK